MVKTEKTVHIGHTTLAYFNLICFFSHKPNKTFLKWFCDLRMECCHKLSLIKNVRSLILTVVFWVGTLLPTKLWAYLYREHRFQQKSLIFFSGCSTQWMQHSGIYSLNRGDESLSLLWERLSMLALSPCGFSVSTYAVTLQAKGGRTCNINLVIYWSI